MQFVLVDEPFTGDLATYRPPTRRDFLTRTSIQALAEHERRHRPASLAAITVGVMAIRSNGSLRPRPRASKAQNHARRPTMAAAT